jgi:hypothetical protein
MEDMNTLDLTTLRICWGTPIAEVENPDHRSIKSGVEQHCYERCARDQRAIASGVAPVAKTGLYESAFDLFQTQAPFVSTYEDLGTKIWPLGTVTIGPREGSLLLFPSYVRHSAALYRGHKDRIVIAFNARVRSSRLEA